MELRHRRERLGKFLRLCRNPSEEEAKSAARRTLREIQELKPTMWRWPADVRVRYTLDAQPPFKWKDGRLKEVLFVRVQVESVDYRLLHKAIVAVRIGTRTLLLPVDSAEPMW